MRRVVSGARIVFALFAAVGCAGSTRDVIPETHDVQVAATGDHGGYAYVARRPLAFVALASEEGLGAELGARAVDHLADALDACATTLGAKGQLVDGGIRVDATVAPGGAVVVSHVTVAPGDAVAANALLCVMAPLRLTTFAPGDGGARRFVIDASWGPTRGRGG